MCGSIQWNILKSRSPTNTLMAWTWCNSQACPTESQFLEDTQDKPDELSAKISLYQNIKSALDILDEREKEIVEMRFGINGSSTFTLDEIGSKYNLTRERIRQIEKNALKKIKKINGQTLKGFLN